MRVVVAAETQDLAEHVAHVINHRRGVELQAMVRGLDAASPFADQCDTVILVHGCESAACLNAVHKLKFARPDLQIVVANMPNVSETIVTFLEAGVIAYQTEDDPLTLLPNVLRSLERGEVHVEPTVAALMLDRIVNLREQVPLPPEDVSTAWLTARQRQVLGLIAQNKTNEEIADELFIEIGTVKNHVHRILHKLGARDRREAVRIAASVPEDDGFSLQTVDPDAGRGSGEI